MGTQKALLGERAATRAHSPQASDPAGLGTGKTHRDRKENSASGDREWKERCLMQIMETLNVEKPWESASPQ